MRPMRLGLVLLLVLGTVGTLLSVSLPAVSSDQPQEPRVQGVCPPVAGTPRFTIAYGTIYIAGVPAPVGTVVEARSPRGDTVGCFVVTTTGHYGQMYVYGEDVSVMPVIPGMRENETVAFHVDGTLATATPILVWHDDKQPHAVDLSVASILPTDTPTPTTAASTATATPAATSTPSATPTRTPAVTRTIPLVDGWNLIGLPLAPVSERLEDVLADVPWSAAYTWDCASQGWLTAFRSVPGPQTFVNVDETVGFWVCVDSAVTLTVGGDLPVSTQVPLCPGWNLISFPASASRSLPAALASIAGAYSLVYEYDPLNLQNPWRRYNPAAPVYASDLLDLSPGRGYWIQATAPIVLTVE